MPRSDSTRLGVRFARCLPNLYRSQAVVDIRLPWSCVPAGVTTSVRGAGVAGPTDRVTPRPEIDEYLRVFVAIRCGLESAQGYRLCHGRRAATREVSKSELPNLPEEVAGCNSVVAMCGLPC
jgi:hypothetical protein